MEKTFVYVVTELMCDEHLTVIVFLNEDDAIKYREEKAEAWHNIDKDSYMRELSDIMPGSSDDEFYETEIYEIKIHKSEVL